jgi:hypothetical protein
MPRGVLQEVLGGQPWRAPSLCRSGATPAGLAGPPRLRQQQRRRRRGHQLMRGLLHACTPVPWEVPASVELPRCV